MWLVIRILILTWLSVRLGIDARKVQRGLLPATRLFLPTLLFIGVALVGAQLVAKPFVAAVMVAVELGLLVPCVVLVRSIRADGSAAFLEERLETAFQRFFPAWFARLAGTDITVLLHARRGLRAFMLPQSPGATSYTNGSKIALLALIVGLSVLPDAIFLLLVIPRAYGWVSIVLALLDLWGCVWLFGLYGTMAARPHEVSPERIVLRNGLVQRVEFAPQHICELHAVGIIKRRQLPSSSRTGSVFLGFGGVPMVEITLSEPAIADHILWRGPRATKRIFAAADMPEQLCASIRALAAAP